MLAGALDEEETATGGALESSGAEKKRPSRRSGGRCLSGRGSGSGGRRSGRWRRERTVLRTAGAEEEEQGSRAEADERSDDGLRGRDGCWGQSRG